MFLIRTDKETQLYCKHCADLAAEEIQINNKNTEALECPDVRKYVSGF